MKLFKKNSPFLLLLLLFIIINAVLRTVLLFHPITQSEFNLSEIVKIFLLGGLSDMMIYFVGSAFLWLYLLFLSDKKYQTPNGYIVFAVL
ncbi:MAG: LTA synthase family protein, partial [Flavobacterium sp.]